MNGFAGKTARRIRTVGIAGCIAVVIGFAAGCSTTTVSEEGPWLQLPADQARLIMREEMQAGGFELSREDVDTHAKVLPYVEKQWDELSRVRIDSKLYPELIECLQTCDLAAVDSTVFLKYALDVECGDLSYARPYLRGTYMTGDGHKNFFGFFLPVQNKQQDKTKEEMQQILRSQVQSFVEWLKAQELNS